MAKIQGLLDERRKEIIAKIHQKYPGLTDVSEDLLLVIVWRCLTSA